MRAKEVQAEMCGTGSTMGFDAQGHSITAAHLRASRCWCVDTVVTVGEIPIQSSYNLCSRRFPTKRQAAEHAATLIDDTQTALLKWW